VAGALDTLGCGRNQQGTLAAIWFWCGFGSDVPPKTRGPPPAAEPTPHCERAAPAGRRVPAGGAAPPSCAGAPIPALDRWLYGL